MMRYASGQRVLKIIPESKRGRKHGLDGPDEKQLAWQRKIWPMRMPACGEPRGGHQRKRERMTAIKP